MSDRMGWAKLVMKAAAILLLLAPGSGAAPTAAPEPARAEAGPPAGEKNRTIAILVRHAEKANDGTADPPLSERGVRRAEALARLLSEAGVTHLFASEFRRARETLAPLAAGLGLEVRVIEALEADRQAAAIRALPAGSVAVVAGHSNTVPGILRSLGGKVSDLVDGPGGPMIADEIHDRMFLVILPAGGGAAPVDPAQTVELRYGE